MPFILDSTVAVDTLKPPLWKMLFQQVEAAIQNDDAVGCMALIDKLLDRYQTARNVKTSAILNEAYNVLH